MSKVALVTGGAGAIGRHVVRELCAGGWRVASLGHGRIASHPACRAIDGDIDERNLTALMAELGGFDAVIHLAGGATVGASLAAPFQDFERTVGAGVRLLEWVRLNTPNAALVLASSAAVYGDHHEDVIPENAAHSPHSPYGYHKAMLELAWNCWAKNYGLKASIVRLFSVYGPGLYKQLVFEIFARLADGESTITLGGTGREQRDWIFIEDAASILIGAIAEATCEVVTLNACTGCAVSVADAARAAIDAFDSTAALCFTGKSRAGDPQYLVGDPTNSRARGLVAMTSLRDGLLKTAADFRAAQNT